MNSSNDTADHDVADNNVADVSRQDEACHSITSNTSNTDNIGNTSSSNHTLFLGDKGELAFDTRRALVQLLAGPSLDGRRHSKLWPILLRDEIVVRRYLSELFLELVIDRDIQVAFTRQAETDDLEVPLLLRRAQLTFIDSILLLYLRQRLTQAGSQGERAVVSTEEITEYLALYERHDNTDRAGFIKRVHASIEKIKKHNILQKIRSNEERFEISPTLKLLFSAEEIIALTELYKRMAVGEIVSEATNNEKIVNIIEENEDYSS